MNLFLFANFFPYKKAEPFLVNEFEFAKRKAKSIDVFTLYGKSEDVLWQSTLNLNWFRPVLESEQNKKSLFIKGLFNFSDFSFHLKEFFFKKLFLSPGKAYWLLVSLLITRSTIASESYKVLIKKINAAEEPILYFYWGDNLCWIIPYLKTKLVNKKVKIVVRLHGSDLYENLKNDYSPLRTIIFSHADLIVPISEFGEKYIKSKYPQFGYKLFLSRLGVFDNGLSPKTSLANEYNIVSVSNVVAIKRLDLIFDALQNTSSIINWHHFGDGPLFEQLSNRIKSSRTNLRIHLHGFVPNIDVIRFYKETPVTLFINASSTEGLPVSIMEALSFGIPVIATNVGGTSELVNSKNGILIDSNFEISLLASSVETILNLNSSEYNKLRENARKTFEERVNAEENYNLFYEKLG